MTDMPDELRGIDQKLRSVRFVPRASFGPELRGRLRRGDQPSGSGHRSLRRQLATAAAVVLTAGVALTLASVGTLGHIGAVTVDRCCYDLDGGGGADDGALILAEPDARVHRIRVYEDLDRSRSYTPGDLVRLNRGGNPVIQSARGDGVVATQRCCLDFDGGGPDDDGLLLIGVPPDRILMAAIYETGPKARRELAEGWLLR